MWWLSIGRRRISFPIRSGERPDDRMRLRSALKCDSVRLPRRRYRRVRLVLADALPHGIDRQPAPLELDHVCVVLPLVFPDFKPHLPQPLDRVVPEACRLTIGRQQSRHAKIGGSTSLLLNFFGGSALIRGRVHGSFQEPRQVCRPNAGAFFLWVSRRGRTGFSVHQASRFTTTSITRSFSVALDHVVAGLVFLPVSDDGVALGSKAVGQDGCQVFGRRAVVQFHDSDSDGKPFPPANEGTSPHPDAQSGFLRFTN